MAFLHKALEREFGKSYDKNSPEVLEFTEKFRERKNKLFGENFKLALIESSVSLLDFYPGLQVKYNNELAVVDKIVENSHVILTTASGKKEKITEEDLDCYYYFDDFFTRPNEELLSNFGFTRIEQTNTVKENDKGFITFYEIWQYIGDHPVTKLQDFWFCYVFMKQSQTTNHQILDKFGVSLPEYHYTLFCGHEQVYQDTLTKVGMEHIEYSFNQAIKNYIPLRFNCKNEDIIITDPCYLFGGPNFDECIEKVRGIHSTTLCGDWSCTVFEEGSKNVLGNFNADAGQVCIYKVKDVLEVCPDFDVEIDSYISRGLATVIRNFTGEVSLEFTPAKGMEEFRMQYGTVRVIGKGNVNFYSSRTGA